MSVKELSLSELLPQFPQVSLSRQAFELDSLFRNYIKGCALDHFFLLESLLNFAFCNFILFFCAALPLAGCCGMLM